MTTARLDREQRQRAMRDLRERTFDVVVIGGGVTGAGAALDAVGRGLNVALLEREDWAAGTSSKSGKLFHGGLRYLEQFKFGLVSESLRERGLMVRELCPHLVRPVPFLYPLTHYGWERLYVGSGVALYDVMGGAGRGVPRHRHLTRRQALRRMPSLRGDKLIGALQYYDVQVDDARHTMMVARTAATYGTVVATRTEALGFLGDREGVYGVQVRDRETGEEISVRSRCVINAAGVWTDFVQDMAGDVALKVRPAKGIHLIVPRDRVDSQTALIARTEDSVFIVRPWGWSPDEDPGVSSEGQYWLLGTTDTKWDYDRDETTASGADVDYLLAQANSLLKRKLTRDDIVGVYAGLRPLVEGTSESSAGLSREHEVAETVPNLFTIAGGKYTTYRVMAQDAVDAAAARLQKMEPAQAIPPSVTRSTPIVGASGFQVRRNQRAQLARQNGLSVAQVQRLLRRYGALVDEVFEMITQRPELGRPIEGAPSYLQVEALYGATHEGALGLADVLMRRTHIAIETQDRGLRAARPVARLIAEALGWDDQRVNSEVDSYEAQMEADRQGEHAESDGAAVDARRRVLQKAHA